MNGLAGRGRSGRGQAPRVVGQPAVEFRSVWPGGLMLLSRRLLLVGVASCLGSAAQAADSGVKPLGVFPLALGGSAASRDASPKAFLWCQGASLVGVVVADTKSVDCSAAKQKRSAPRALVLRDGRCEAGGGAVSFGLLVS